MICPNCGRNIPDGTQCPCGMGAPLLSSNPALHVMKSIGSSTVFLVLAILLSCSALLGFFSFLNTDDILFTVYYYGITSGMDTDVLYPVIDALGGSLGVGAVLSSIPAVLMALGVWLLYATCRNRRSGNISTAGLTICKVLSYIHFIAICVVGGVCILFLLLMSIAAGAVSTDYYGYDGAVAAGVAVVMVVLLVAVAAALALVIPYQVSIIKVINRMKRTAMTGVPDNRVSGYLVVMNYILAAFGAIGGLITLFGGTPISGLGSLAGAAALVLSSVCLSRYRREMTALLYPPVQPVYPNQAGYPQQPYQPQPPQQGWDQQQGGYAAPYQGAPAQEAAPRQATPPEPAPGEQPAPQEGSRDSDS